MRRRRSRTLAAAFLLAAGWLAPAAVQADPGISFDFDEVDLPATASAAPSIDLTTSDGAGLRLVTLQADGVLEPPFAFTELRLRFRNPEPRVREGRFRIVLPPDAAISRFAMKIGEHWQEGEVVERQRARRVYEDFLHRRQDPALLEQAAGNEFSARVFPIPAGADKELIISYSHELERADEPYVLPLAGLPTLERLDVRVLVARREIGRPASSLGGRSFDHRIVQVEERDFLPDGDLRIDPEPDPQGGPTALRHENLVVARVEAPFPGTGPGRRDDTAPRRSSDRRGADEAPPVEDPFDAIDAIDEIDEIDSLFVLVDTSASRSLGLDRQLDLLDRLFGGLAAGAGPNLPLAVAAFDQEVELIYEGPVGGWDGHRDLAARGALGASDLRAALRWLASHLGPPEAERYRRLLVVTDGVLTAGEREAGALAGSVRALAEHGVERLDALVVGGRRDEDALARLVTAGLPRHGVVADGDEVADRRDLEALGRRLTRAVSSGIEVAVPGARWVWPRSLDGVQPGDQVLVYADLPSGSPLRIRLAGSSTTYEPRPVARPLLERAWIQARIDRLLHLRETDFAGDPDLRHAMRAEIIELSVGHRVLSPFTALLVLETEADYRRYGIDRRSLADILTVGSRGIEVRRRSTGVSAPPPLPRPQEPEPTELDLAAVTEETWADSHGRVERDARDRRLDEPDLNQRLSEAPARVESHFNQQIIAENERLEALEAEAAALEEELAALEKGLSPPEPEPELQASPVTDETSERPPASGPFEEIQVGSLRAARAPWKKGPAPHVGRFAEVLRELGDSPKKARSEAESWVRATPGDVLALVALGRTCEATGDGRRAARAYGSLIDLFPSRADLRRFAGELLSGLDRADRPLDLVIDTFRVAVEQRPDHPSSHRLLAWALLDAGRPQQSFEALAVGLGQRYPSGRFAGVEEILRQDLGLIAAVWKGAEPAERETLDRRLRDAGGVAPVGPSLRFVLQWETDANDVDLHVVDGEGHHAYYEHKQLASGGRLYADVTTGFGPECLTVFRHWKRRAYPYRVRAHYYRRGPMGYGMGALQILDHDGAGDLSIETRPYVVMVDGAFVDLGIVKRPVK